MTNYYDQISKDELMKDKCLILLIESYSSCKANNQERIKRSNLLRLCNNKLDELSDGDRPKFGGSFEACLKKYSDTAAAPDKRFFTVERTNVRHNTQIYPNFDLIEKKLRAKRILDAYTNPNTVTKTIRAFPSDSFHASASVGISVRRADSKKFIEEVKSELCTFLKSDLLEICISTKENSNSDLQLSQDIVKQFESLLEQIALNNNMTKERFSLNLEYTGIPATLLAIERSGKRGIFYTRLYLHFEKWLRDYQNDSITEEEMTMLRKGDLKSLSQNKREKLRSFLSSIEDHHSGSLGNDDDESLHQIIVELKKDGLD